MRREPFFVAPADWEQIGNMIGLALRMYRLSPPLRLRGTVMASLAQPVPGTTRFLTTLRGADRPDPGFLDRPNTSFPRSCTYDGQTTAVDRNARGPGACALRRPAR